MDVNAGGILPGAEGRAGNLIASNGIVCLLALSFAIHYYYMILV